MENFKNYGTNESSDTEIQEITTVGENLDLKGGQVVNAPDFVDLLMMGFSEDELKLLLKLRRRFEQGEHDVTPEIIRLRFAKFLYENGKIDA
ncbi:hypothetical protein [Candidatus Chlorohelix sp.]|uniref:hypothetical protein n=1 Tax=Candidatus Chlorohelix sp. TaxID=3139201 RepID=UPI003037A449